MPDTAQIAVVEDEDGIRDALIKMFARLGIVAQGYPTAEAFLRAIPDSIETVFTDIRLPGMSGLEMLHELRSSGRDLAVVVMSAYGTLDTALQAIREGAFDYLSKPIAPSNLETVLEHLSRHRAMGLGDLLLEDWDEVETFANMVGESAGMRAVFAYIQKVAQFNTTVLIQGESGVGKERVARAIHDLGSRKDKPFLCINCGAIPENLLESELFGVTKGAYTGADRDRTGVFREAHSGTLFLDEIGELPLALQVKLLRVLQEGEVRPVGSSQPQYVDVRIIAASLKDIDKQVQEGAFREDLYFRLNVMEIKIPALRFRQADVAPLTVHFLRNLIARHGKKVIGLDSKILQRFYSYSWPGNVRQLENVLERALILSEGDLITEEGLHLDSGVNESPAIKGEWVPQSLSVKKETALLETHLIKKALRQTGGNQRQASEILEISPRALIYKMKEYGLRKDVREANGSAPE